MFTIPTKHLPKIAHEFFCENCDYKCGKKSIFDKHLLTKKHNTTKSDKILHQAFVCECGKSYPYRASLYNHKRNCQEKLQKGCSEIDLKDLVAKTLAENKDLVYAIHEQQKIIHHIISLLE